uniref:Nucleolar protein 14 n=1 Tax=Timema shepardi TaxID=629360 RepID=A0A7R9AP69_TIMSH|nr:unnamed protein product [Timema shepardi]
MAKKKKISDKVNRINPTNKSKILNPFEVHVNKQKFNILGRKSKSDKGLPGVARSKAIKKRKATLLQEYRVKGKSNKFLDMRIGEKNHAMTPEDRIMARFTAERMKSHKKKSVFNMADEEILTHHGQSLNEIENFDDPRSDEEEDIEESGKLDARFVGDAHFGGGMLKKTSDDGAISRKNLIEQLIAESKKRKVEKQRAREQTLDLTEKLDTDWKDLLPIVSASKKSSKDTQESFKPDPYDTVMRELKFEARGKVRNSFDSDGSVLRLSLSSYKGLPPSDRLKTGDEIAKEEKERLEKLEAERQDRMKGFTDETPVTTSTNKHRSADDLDDGFEIDSDPEVTLAYNEEGELIGPVSLTESQKSADKEEIKDKFDSSNDDSEGDDDDDNDDDDDDDDKTKSYNNNSAQGVNLKKTETNNLEPVEVKEKIDEPKSDDDDDDKESHEDESEDNMSDLKQDSDSEEETLDEPADSKDQESTVIEKQSTSEDREKIKADLSARKQMMEQAREELPYTFQEVFYLLTECIWTVPANYEGLQELLTDRNSDYQAVVVERMVKCNHPSLKEGNKDRLASLFGYLLQHLNDVAASQQDGEKGESCFTVLDRLAPHFYDLAHFEKENAVRCVLEVLKEKQHDFRKHPKTFPDLDTLIFFKLVSLLFPTSDFRHQVVTPALVFMGQLLSQCRVKTKADIAKGLFICTLFLEYTDLSKRFTPAAISFLHGLVQLAVLSPAKPKGRTANMLVLSQDMSGEEPPESSLMCSSDLTDGIPGDDHFKTRALHTTVKLLSEFLSQLDGLPSCYEVFKPVSCTLSRLDSSKYPLDIQKDIAGLVLNITALESRKIQLLVVEKKKPRALRLYEPNIEEVFDGMKKRPMGRTKQERAKLLHKYKREMKGAMREIRRDKSFLAKLKLKETLTRSVTIFNSMQKLPVYRGQVLSFIIL